MAESRKKQTVVLNKVSAPRPHDLLADQLSEAILRGDIAEGESLPPERELVEQTGLTRGSVREALRLLAAKGLVRTRPGRFGGNIVTLPGTEWLADGITQFIRGRRLPLRVLNEARQFLEPALARLAALHRTEEDLEKLKALHQELIEAGDNFQRFSILNINWHKAIASASGNALLSGFLYAISFGIAVSTTTEEYNTADTRKQVIGIHSEIMAAIEARDADLAEARMRRHIDATHARATPFQATGVPMSFE
jgi:GntR family transcriptional regulator, transcriptional repressor for pyruvate dehydrogenase complex